METWSYNQNHLKEHVGGGGGGGAGVETGIIVVHVWEPVFQNLLHSYT